MARALVVEDDADIATLITHYLERDGWRCDVARDGLEALNRLGLETYRLVVLDLQLPGKDGLSVLTQIRASPKLRNLLVVIVTARSEETDRIVGLEIGADDYIVKPFSLGELQARIAGHLRRANPAAAANGQKQISIGKIDIDFERHEIMVKGEVAYLAPKEFAILKLLVEAKGKVLSREQMLQLIWGHDKDVEIDTRTVDQHIARLRRKLRTEAEHIKTVPNFGYQVSMK